MIHDQILVSDKPFFIRVFSLNPLHQSVDRAYIHTPQASLAVMIVKTFVDHCLSALVFPLHELKDHIRACGIAQAAVDTSVLDEQGNVSFPGRGEIIGYRTPIAGVYASVRSIFIAPPVLYLCVGNFFISAVRRKMYLLRRLISPFHTLQIPLQKCGILLSHRVSYQIIHPFRRYESGGFYNGSKHHHVYPAFALHGDFQGIHCIDTACVKLQIIPERFR